jgi:hypothetical protein
MSKLDPRDLDDGATLEIMLALAERELGFLIEHFNARDVGATTSGAELIEALEVAKLAALRVRSELPALVGEAETLQRAIRSMKSDT